MENISIKFLSNFEEDICRQVFWWVCPYFTVNRTFTQSLNLYVNKTSLYWALAIDYILFPYGFLQISCSIYNFSVSTLTFHNILLHFQQIAFAPTKYLHSYCSSTLHTEVAKKKKKNLKANTLHTDSGNFCYTTFSHCIFCIN